MHTGYMTRRRSRKWGTGKKRTARQSSGAQLKTHPGHDGVKEGGEMETQTEKGRVVSMAYAGLGCCCLPVRLGCVFSLGLLSLAQWDSLPEEAPVPRPSSQAVLISTLLGLRSVVITVYIVYERHCTYCPTHTQTQTGVCMGYSASENQP